MPRGAEIPKSRIDGYEKTLSSLRTRQLTPVSSRLARISERLHDA
jgi:hypothetical protein